MTTIKPPRNRPLLEEACDQDEPIEIAPSATNETVVCITLNSEDPVVAMPDSSAAEPTSEDESKTVRFVEYSRIASDIAVGLTVSGQAPYHWDAEDAVQETLVSMLSRDVAPESPRAYLRSALINSVRASFRRTHTTPTTPNRLVRMSEASPDDSCQPDKAYVLKDLVESVEIRLKNSHDEVGLLVWNQRFRSQTAPRFVDGGELDLSLSQKYEACRRVRAVAREVFSP